MAAKSTLKKLEAKPAQSEDKSNYYASLTPELRKDAALEMAQEIRVHNERMAILAAAIQNYIGEPEQSAKGEDAEFAIDAAKHLIATLVDQISNAGQQRRLIECLQAM